MYKNGVVNLLNSKCSMPLCVLVLLLCSLSTLKAKDTTLIVKHKKIGIGVTSSLISHTGWSNTKPYIIDNGSFIPFFTRALVHNGVCVNWNFYGNFYIESGANFNTEDIPKLADNTFFSPTSPYNQSVWLSYEAKYMQIPLSISYSAQKSTSFYAAIGIKNNFIHYENLSGSYNITSNELKFNNIAGFFHLGGNVFLLKNRLRFTYFFSADTNPLYHERNGITNFTYYKFGFNNVALFYNFL